MEYRPLYQAATFFAFQALPCYLNSSDVSPFIPAAQQFARQYGPLSGEPWPPDGVLLKLLYESHIVLNEHAQVGYSMHKQRDALDTHAESETVHLLRVVADLY